jgi:glycosyltransferase involved in cell wall biosynthesis
MPLFSIVIAVYNDWAALGACLHSLVPQAHRSSVEVVVVDDGSDETVPDEIQRYACLLPLTVLRQPHAGIATARNFGIAKSSGSILLFADADSRFQESCLAVLESIIAKAPQRNSFQLHLVGDCSSLVGRAETLRLMTLQNHMLATNGSIRYLNTAGFAIRRSSLKADGGLFDPRVLRGEDTLLLASLIERQELPLFAKGATIKHDVTLSWLRCLCKDLRSAFLERKTYDLIAQKRIRLRMSHGERLKFLWSMWKASKHPAIGRSAWFVLTIRHSLKRISSLAASLSWSIFSCQTLALPVVKRRMI